MDLDFATLATSAPHGCTSPKTDDLDERPFPGNRDHRATLGVNRPRVAYLRGADNV